MKERSRGSRTARSILAALAIGLMVMSLPGCGDDDSGNAPANTPTPTPMPAGTPTGTPDIALPDWAEKIASAGAEKGLRELIAVSGIPVPAFIENPLIGLILGNIFKGGSNPGPTTMQVLKQIQGTLADIENRLASIANQLSLIEAELAIDTSAIERQVAAQGMDPYVVHTNALWAQYLALHHADGTWDTNDADLQDLATAILDSNAGEFPQLQAIHDLLTGENDVSGGTLAAVANAAQTSALSGGNPNFDCYMLIENYFGAVLRAQMRGATLMMEALKYREANTTFSAGPESYPGTAVYFATWYQKQIEDEVEVFLQQTEAFVTATAHPQQAFDAFVPSADKIFWRADLVAAWLSTKHRVDPNNPAVGQQFMVYRVIGGPDRVAQYGTSFSTGSGPAFRSIQFEATGVDADYSVPQYTQTDHHAYSNLRPETSPYVQFAAPLNHNGGVTQNGVLKDANEISTGVYCIGADTSGDHLFNQPYYLNDIPTHTTAAVHYVPVTSAGETPNSGDDQILYGYALDVQHPPTLLMGAWDVRESHSDHSGLQSLGKVLHGETTAGSQWASLFVNAWPTYIPDREEPGGGWVSGSFTEANALEGYFYWAGTGSPQLRLDWSASFTWDVDNNGSPADRTCGLLVWMGGPSGHDTSERLGYQNVGSGTNALHGWDQVAMAPNSGFYISFGPHMQMDWGGTGEMPYDNWHHWYATYKVTPKTITLTLPQ